MKQFENDLKYIQSEIKPPVNFVISSALNISNDRLTILKAKGLIKIDRYYDNDLKISLTDSGITYFSDKDENRNKIVLSRIEAFVFNLLSAAVGSAITLFIQWLVK